ncbi:MAG: hypothetical protein MI976_05305 [Pseudomonadales bacterium]|nr:hypothetical protein [Pseudomonadales bacterium]
MHRSIKYGAAIIAFSSMLAGCGGSSGGYNNQNDDGANLDLPDSIEENAELNLSSLVIVQTVAADYSGSSVQFIIPSEDSVEVSDETLLRDLSDYDVFSFGDDLYHVGRYNIDLIGKYDITNDLQQAYLYDLLDDPEDNSANIYEIAFVNDSKAYLIRYGQPNIWIINPSAETEDEFKLGELSLADYEDQDSSVEASDGIIVDGKLFVAMQRFNSAAGNPLTNSAYVAVFDIATDTEIDTDPTDDPSNLYGIELSIHNTNNFAYHETAGLFLSGSGDPWGQAYYGRGPGFEGGLVKIDTDSYTETMLIDDGNATDHPYGYFQDIAIIDENNGFFVGLAAYQDTSLYHFNPTTGETTEVDELSNIDIGALSVSPSGNLWVGIFDASDPHLVVLNSDLVNLAEIDVAQNPKTILFKELD